MKYIYRILWMIIILNIYLFGVDLVANGGEDKIVNYKWYEGDKYIDLYISRWYVFSKNGEHNITLKLTDSTGKIEEDNVTITVVNAKDIKKCDKSTAITRDELRAMIANNEDVTEVNTCMIKDMSYLVFPNVMFFKNDSMLTEEQKNNIKNFNQDISGWDVSNVTNMKGMFNSAVAFNQPIGLWDVSSVSNMDDMFNTAKEFNQPIGLWDVSSVGVIEENPSGMDNMFTGAKEFNQDIKNWDISATLDLSLYYEYDWDTYIIKNGNYWFANESALEDEYNPFINISLSSRI